MIATDAPKATAPALPLTPVPMATATAPAPAMISESFVARTVIAPPASTVLLRSVAVVSASIWLLEPEPAPEIASPLCWAEAFAAANEPASVKALILPVASASIERVPSAPGCQVIVLVSTRASVSVAISLTATATPTDAAAALSPPPLAMATDRLPAMAKMSAASVARTRASLVTSLHEDGSPGIVLAACAGSAFNRFQRLAVV